LIRCRSEQCQVDWSSAAHANHNQIGVTLARRTQDFGIRLSVRDELSDPVGRVHVFSHQ
jgi:hypothetical protein